MVKCKSKSIDVGVISFYEFLDYGRNNGANIVNGMPWSFSYNGAPVTHENDKCYIISSLGNQFKFTPDDVLITDDNGNIYPLNILAYINLFFEL